MNEELFIFRLYVTGDVPNSLLAIANLTLLCEEHLAGRHTIEIVDVLLEPKRALAESILLTPLLVTEQPYPGHRIVGTLSQTEPILQILGLGVAQRRDFTGLKERDAASPMMRQTE